MKSKMLTILGVVAALHLIVIGVIALSGGCRHPEVLKERPNVPPPSLLPPDEQPQPVIEKKIIKQQAPAPQPAPLPQPTIAPPAEQPEKQVEKKSPIKSQQLTHKVKAGESFWTIARQYGVSAGELAAANNMPLEKAKSLKVGTVLTIPPGGAPVPPEKLQKEEKASQQQHKASAPAQKSSSSTTKHGTESVASKEPAPADGVYVVKNGDSLWKIANKFGVSQKAITEANKLDASKPLQVGQKIVIPVAGKATAQKTPETGKKVESAQAAKTSTTPSSEDIKVDEKPTLDATTKPQKDDLNEMLGVSEGKNKAGLPADNKEAAKAQASASALPAEDAPIVVDEIIETPPANVEFILHESVDGETVESLATMYGTRIEDILSLNPNLKRGVKLNTGLTIKIPKPK